MSVEGSAGNPGKGRPTAAAVGAGDYLHLYTDEYHASHLDWARAENRIFKHYLKAYCELIQPRPGMRILELGCSAGKTTRALAERGCQVTAVDFDARAIDYARRWLGESTDSQAAARVKFVCDSADRVPIDPAQLDMITMLDFVEHVPDGLLVSIFNHIRQSGFRGPVCVYTPDRRHFTERMRDWGIIAQDPTHINLKSTPEWCRFVQAQGFTIQARRREVSHWPVLSKVERAFSGLPGVGPWLTRSLSFRAVAQS